VCTQQYYRVQVPTARTALNESIALQWRIHGGLTPPPAPPNREKYVSKINNFHYRVKIFFNPPPKENPGAASVALGTVTERKRN
jgi:hypothetical protein